MAKHSFQLHGAAADGSVVFRRKLTRQKLPGFLASQPPCVVAMEACASAHYWGRESLRHGHQVRLVPPTYVKPFVKRQKNDENDAEAICESAQRPTMSFVAVKTDAQQARGMLFRTRDLLVRQRTQTINALRGHLAEFGVVAPKGPRKFGRLASALEDPESRLPESVRELGGVPIDQILGLEAKIGELDRELRACACEDEQAARLMTIPGVGPITATALQAFAPPMESFRRGRDFSAWLGLVPRQHTTGGKPRLGKVSKMGHPVRTLFRPRPALRRSTNPIASETTRKLAMMSQSYQRRIMANSNSSETPDLSRTGNAGLSHGIIPRAVPRQLLPEPEYAPCATWPRRGAPPAAYACRLGVYGRPHG